MNRAISELFSRGDPARLLLSGSSTDGTVPFNWQKIKACINLSCEARRLAKALHDVRNSADPSSVGARDLFATCPALARLTLSEAERHALARQGFVAVERRGRRCYFKLRFRAAGGRQCVRYLGSDPAVAAQVRQVLDRLQHPRRQARAVKQWTRHARRLLRASKLAAAPAVHALGYRFHGFALRRPRAAATAHDR